MRSMTLHRALLYAWPTELGRKRHFARKCQIFWPTPICIIDSMCCHVQHAMFAKRKLCRVCVARLNRLGRSCRVVGGAGFRDEEPLLHANANLSFGVCGWPPLSSMGNDCYPHKRMRGLKPAQHVLCFCAEKRAPITPVIVMY